MSTIPALRKAGAYLGTQIRSPGVGSIRNRLELDGPYITVSREAGSGGSSFAKALVRELNARAQNGQPPWVLYDGNLVESFLSEARLPEQLSRYLPENRISAIEASIGEVVGLHPNLWTLVTGTNEMVRRLAGLGHAVIVGRGGNFAASGVPNGINIRLVGSVEGRAHRMAEARACSLEDALIVNRNLDAARREYVRSAFDRDVSDMRAYDLVINTDSFTIEEAVDALMTVLGHRGLAKCRS